MAKKRKFTQSELEKHLENIDIYWHRQGDSKEFALIDYIRELYAAIPSELRELSAEEYAERTVEIDRAHMVYQLRAALFSVYSEDDIESAVDEILGQSSAERDGSPFFKVNLGSFRSAFANKFKIETLSAELLKETNQALELILAKPEVTPRRSLVAERQRMAGYQA